MVRHRVYPRTLVPKNWSIHQDILVFGLSVLAQWFYHGNWTYSLLLVLLTYYGVPAALRIPLPWVAVTAIGINVVAVAHMVGLLSISAYDNWARVLYIVGLARGWLHSMRKNHG